jgi:tetratricopeptide (TPR) repeat protein
LGFDRKNFEEEGHEWLDSAEKQCKNIQKLVRKLVRDLQKRKTQRILISSLELAEFIILTKIPSLIVTTLDYLIPILMLLNEIRLIKKYSENMLKFARKINDTYGKLRGCQYKAFYYRKTGDFEKAIRRYFKMLMYCLKTKDHRNELEAYGLIGMCYYYKGELEKALPFQERSVSGRVEPEESRHRLVLDKHGRKVRIETLIKGKNIPKNSKKFNSQIYGKATYEPCYSDSEHDEITLFQDYSHVNASDILIDMTPGEK